MGKQPDSQAAGRIDTLLTARELSRESLQHLITMAEKGEWRLVNWERFGQPRIDKVLATVEGPVKQGGSFVDGVINAPGVRSRIRDVFPKGVPVIDRLRIEFEVTPGLG